VDISRPAYQALLKQTGDECGTTLLAGRSIATPFVGAFAGAVLFGLALGTQWNLSLLGRSTSINCSGCYG
jgi:hypothetical protein